MNEKMRNEPRLDVWIALVYWNCGKEYSDVPLNQRWTKVEGDENE